MGDIYDEANKAAVSLGIQYARGAGDFFDKNFDQKRFKGIQSASLKMGAIFGSTVSASVFAITYDAIWREMGEKAAGQWLTMAFGELKEMLGKVTSARSR